MHLKICTHTPLCAYLQLSTDVRLVHGPPACTSVPLPRSGKQSLSALLPRGGCSVSKGKPSWCQRCLAKARHRVVVGPTLIACVSSGETWRFEGFLGEKDPLTQKKKGEKSNHLALLELLLGPWTPDAALLHDACFYSPGGFRRMATDLKVPCQLYSTGQLQEQERTPGLSPHPAGTSHV